MKTKYFKELKARIPVLDAKKSVIMNRTQGDIDKGERGKITACMDFQCAKRVVTSASARDNPFVPYRVVGILQYPTVAWIIAAKATGQLYGVRYLRPENDVEDIERFDKGEMVEPRPIHFLAPGKFKRMGARPSRTNEQRGRIRGPAKSNRMMGSKLRMFRANTGIILASA